MTDMLSGPVTSTAIGRDAHAVTRSASDRDAHAVTRTASDRDADAWPWTAPSRDARPLPTPPTGGHTHAPRPLTATHVTASKEYGHG
ncbi:putative uncharacterized protein [Streptomyces azureus]|uniref:Uncharacterized protein n=1 Tax=Streptomyces azureus TaxID=146537 RepID=A0A0K8PXB6_STRAJ|nr:putative uncharacterized protein [Streptomyces azureus]